MSIEQDEIIIGRGYIDFVHTSIMINMCLSPKTTIQRYQSSIKPLGLPKEPHTHMCDFQRKTLYFGLPPHHGQPHCPEMTLIAGKKPMKFSDHRYC